MQNTLSKKDRLLQLLCLPIVCSLCYQYHTQVSAICHKCLSFFRVIENPCLCCASPISEQHLKIKNDALLCSACFKKRPIISAVYTKYIFEEPLRTLLHNFKYHAALYFKKFLAELILESLCQKALQTECLIPIPMHPNKLRVRGFNQALELTKILSNLTKIPYRIDLCEKIIQTEPQVNLSSKQRQINLKHAFRVLPNNYKHVTLVDDLITTGTTVNVLANLFKKQGVKQIDAWCCARTVKE